MSFNYLIDASHSKITCERLPHRHPVSAAIWRPSNGLGA